MSNIVTVGKRLIPRGHIAFVEPYEPSANSRIQTTREFHGRAVLLDRESILIEQLPQAFAEANGFRMLEADRVATNPAIHFRVESFLPAEGFTAREGIYDASAVARSRRQRTEQAAAERAGNGTGGHCAGPVRHQLACQSALKFDP